MRSILDQYRQTTGKITVQKIQNQDYNIEQLKNEFQKADYTPEQLVDIGLQIIGNTPFADNSFEYKTRVLVSHLIKIKQRNDLYRESNNLNLGDNKKR